MVCKGSSRVWGLLREPMEPLWFCVHVCIFPSHMVAWNGGQRVLALGWLRTGRWDRSLGIPWLLQHYLCASCLASWAEMIYSRALANKIGGGCKVSVPLTRAQSCSLKVLRTLLQMLYYPSRRVPLNLLWRWIDFLACSRASENLATLNQLTRSPLNVGALCGHNYSGWGTMLGGCGPIFPNDTEENEKRLHTAFECCSLSLAVRESHCYFRMV